MLEGVTVKSGSNAQGYEDTPPKAHTTARVVSNHVTVHCESPGESAGCAMESLRFGLEVSSKWFEEGLGATTSNVTAGL